VFIIPYVQLQLQGLGYILHVSSLNTISINVGMAISLIVVLIYVYTSGLRGIAWTNFLQGIFMFIIAWGVVFAVPFLKFGGIGSMFEKLLETKPQMLYLHKPLGIPWYLSTMILSGLGFFIWPHLWPSIFGAKDIKPLKKTYVVLPLYSFFMLPVVLAGFTVAAAGLKLSVADEAILKAIEITFPKWVLGVVGAAGFAAAASTASAIILAAAGLTASNIYRIAKPSASDSELVTVSRLFVVFYSLLALILAIVAKGRLVALLLLGYSGITQMFPGAVLGMFWDRVNKWNVTAGLIAGLATIIYLKFFGPGNYLGIHFGLWGLIVNFIVVLIGAAFTRPDRNFEEFRSGLKEVS
jgi:SSS family solute:Na+ symporter